MIDGVAVRELTRNEDERGSLTEVLRSDWPEFTRFGQAIVTVNRPGVVRAWHWHDLQTDVIVVLGGRVRVALFDGRPASRTAGAVEDHVCDGNELRAIFVPPGVWHGYKTVGSDVGTILNFPDRLYDPAHPDEHRAPHDSPDVPFDWGR